MNSILPVAAIAVTLRTQNERPDGGEEGEPARAAVPRPSGRDSVTVGGNRECLPRFARRPSGEGAHDRPGTLESQGKVATSPQGVRRLKERPPRWLDKL